MVIIMDFNGLRAYLLRLNFLLNKSEKKLPIDDSKITQPKIQFYCTRFAGQSSLAGQSKPFSLFVGGLNLNLN